MKNIIKNITEACKDQFATAWTIERTKIEDQLTRYNGGEDVEKILFPYGMYGKSSYNKIQDFKHVCYKLNNLGFDKVIAEMEVSAYAEMTTKLNQAIAKHCQGFNEVSDITLKVTEKGFAITATLDNKATFKTDCILVWGMIVTAHYRYTCKVK